jgi:hypothetical protein
VDDSEAGAEEIQLIARKSLFQGPAEAALPAGVGGVCGGGRGRINAIILKSVCRQMIRTHP